MRELDMSGWIEGDTPDTPENSETWCWVTLEDKRGQRWVRVMKYLNAHVMPLSDSCCSPPDCAVPHNPESDGYCEEYEWTCWSEGYCEHCECEWVWDSQYVKIVAHMVADKPAPMT